MAERDPESCAKGIRYCILHAEEMKKQCIENVKQFTWKKFREHIGDEIRNCYDKLYLVSSILSQQISEHDGFSSL